MAGGQGFYIQRVKKYTLQASDVNNFITSNINNDIITFNKQSDDALIGDNTRSKLWFIVENFPPKEIITSDLIENIGFSYNANATSYGIVVAKGTYTSLAEAQADLAGTDIYYQLATPIETPILVIGNAMAYPNGTFLIEDVVRRSGVYNGGITVDKAIIELDNIYKLNDDGSSTKLDKADATISGDGLSFTHTSLSNGDFVWFDYYYQGTNVKGLSTVYYYGNKMIVSGSGTTAGKVYKIVPTVVDENIVWTKVEV